MKYIEKYLKDIIKVKPLGTLTTKEDELDGISGEMVYIGGKCSNIFISHIDYANWLEKQGEQTSSQTNERAWLYLVSDVLTWKDGIGQYLDDPRVQELAKKLCSEYAQKLYNPSVLSHSSNIGNNNQEPADKVEPKFHEGDWIVQGYNILKIKCVGNTHYCFETVGGYVDDMLISEIDSQFHLWTIQDAKDGDVLAFYCEYKGNKMVQVGIIEKYVGKQGGCSNTFKIYVGVDWENNLKIGEYMGCPDIRPATKEQRDKLFEKMHEAEYDWDTEKKELKKVEESENIKNQIMSEITDLVKDYITQKPAKCSEEEELSCFESALFTAFSDAWQSYLLGEEVNVKQWTKEHSKELLEAAKEELKGHNSAWSEEDEYTLNETIQHLKELIEIDKTKHCACDVQYYQRDIDWLKTLKDRIIA